ncbi:ABC transporter substrate-binding protein [Caldovatus aquaticus]|uniref:ABC transporter substrate-binding protein n=1 Tax=Caldovatus aquaticus TaxID=2865671 RepID=A0ABS7F238_9PROT|nr:ABC transporter substrate-binding protein [Caldovatus aquaticus]MBW8269686.1 ABC transporter substrate-binding protein [Caldovatus aquaticus]
MIRPDPRRRPVLLGAAAAAACAAARFRRAAAQAGGAAAGPAADPVAVVERFHAVLLDVMRHARQLGPRGRERRLRPAMEAAFDLPAMARIAVGPAWTRMTPAQQAAVAEAFADWSVATYAARFDGYSGETFTTHGVTELRGGDRLVRTTLNRSDGEPVQLNYLLRQGADGAWKIVDVYLTGTISELASRRAEFATILREGGPERLAAELRRRSEALLRG